MAWVLIVIAALEALGTAASATAAIITLGHHRDLLERIEKLENK
jgi:hypothetical protein